MKRLPFQRLSLKTRIWLSYLALILVATTSTGVLSHIIAARVLERNVTELNRNTIRKSALLLDEKLQKITVTAMSAMLNDVFTNTMKDIRMKNQASFSENFSRMQDWFLQIKVNEPSIESILVTTPLGDIYPTTVTRQRDQPFLQSEMHRQIQETRHNVWYPEHTDMFFNGNRRVISLVMEPLIDDFTRMEGVYIIVNVSVNPIIEALANELGESAASLFLMTETGENVLPSLTKSAPSIDNANFLSRAASGADSHFDFYQDKVHYLIDYQKIHLTDNWSLIGIRKADDAYKQVAAIQWATIVLISVCALIALLFSRILASLLLRPLSRLVKLMKRVENNDLSVRFTSTRQDEIAQVGSRFNRMLEQIEQLIENITESNRSKRIAEIKALQAQIDPHFLYNTLYTIYWKAELAQYEDVKEMTLSLSKLFQLGLNGGREITTVDKEITHVCEYLNILQLCYHGWFTYEIILDESIRSWPILKVLLQPLAENTILHGFQAIKQGGHLRISFNQLAEAFHIIVEDNGKGMDAETVEKNMKCTETKNASYALRNTYDRLKLYYGELADVRIESVPGISTKVILIIPMKTIQLELDGGP